MLDDQQSRRNTAHTQAGVSAERTSTAYVDEEDDAMVSLQLAGSATDQRPVSLVGWTGAVMIGATLWLGIFALAF